MKTNQVIYNSDSNYIKERELQIRKEGIKVGDYNARIEIARKMLKDNIEICKIKQYIGLSSRIFLVEEGIRFVIGKGEKAGGYDVRIEIARKMLKDNKEIRKIKQYTGLSLDILSKLKNEFKQSMI